MLYFSHLLVSHFNDDDDGDESDDEDDNDDDDDDDDDILTHLCRRLQVPHPQGSTAIKFIM